MEMIQNTSEGLSGDKRLPTFTKNGHGTYVPPSQVERIKLKFVQGKSLRRIAREEGRARQTVTKIIRSADMQQHIDRARGMLYGILSDAADTVYCQIVDVESQTGDPRLAFQLLERVGVIPKRAK